MARFLSSRQPSAAELQRRIISPLSELGELCVIGGLVRDIAFYGLEERPISDIDLVVRCHPTLLARWARGAGAIENRFGGFGLRTEAYKADFWAYSNTWAKTAGHVRLKQTHDLWRCTFFDWDAVVFSIRHQRVYAIPGYLDRLHRRIIDINLLPNPSNKGNLVRALRRLVMWDARPGPCLRQFIFENLRKHEWHDLVETEAHAFHVRFLDAFCCVTDYENQVFQAGIFPMLGRDDRRQSRFEVVQTAAHRVAPSGSTHFLTAGAYRSPEKFNVPRMPTETGDLFADPSNSKRTRRVS